MEILPFYSPRFAEQPSPSQWDAHPRAHARSAQRRRGRGVRGATRDASSEARAGFRGPWPRSACFLFTAPHGVRRAPCPGSKRRPPWSVVRGPRASQRACGLRTFAGCSGRALPGFSGPCTHSRPRPSPSALRGRSGHSVEMRVSPHKVLKQG